MIKARKDSETVECFKLSVKVLLLVLLVNERMETDSVGVVRCDVSETDLI